MKEVEEFKLNSDKLGIFNNPEQIGKYCETERDFQEAFYYLADEEIFQVLKLAVIRSKSDNVIRSAVAIVKNDNIKIALLKDEEIISRVPKYEIASMIKKMTDDGKEKVLRQREEINGIEFDGDTVTEIITRMSSEKVKQILLDEEFFNELGLTKKNIADIICVIEEDNEKESFMKRYGFNIMEQTKIIISFNSVDKKTDFMLENAKELFDFHIVRIVDSFDMESKIEFIKKYKEFLREKRVTVYDIVKKMNSSGKEILEFLYRIDELELSEGEKRKIFAGISNKTKDMIDFDRIDSKYHELLRIRLYDSGMNFSIEEMKKSGTIIPDLDGDLSLYRDLDQLLYVDPMQNIRDEDRRKKIIELCKICPKIRMNDFIGRASSYGYEYVVAEEWIESVYNGMEEDWTVIQKMAYIDTAIGKRVSFAPDQGTEAENNGDERALWRIIYRGYGVCNGVAQVEEYMYKRRGIDCERVDGEKHTYLLVKNVEVPTEHGIVKGDTFVDVTWNLTAGRYGARPEQFCRSYEEMRKLDIDDDGKDHERHKNKNYETRETIDMDVESLRGVYKSIGIANQNGDFPIKALIERIAKVNEETSNWDDNTKGKFDALKGICPEFAICINSTIGIIQNVMFEDCDKFHFERCIASRVYKKQDEEKKSVLFVYFDLGTKGKRFFYADKELGEFVQLSQEEFEKRFDCYDKDKEAHGNKQLWETQEELKTEKAISSGEVPKNGDGR